MTRVPLILAMGISLLAGLALAGLVMMPMASAHDAPLGWKYPWSCCASQDCKQMGDQTVLEKPEGYVIAGTGEVVPYADRRIKDLPDGEFHRCAHQAGLDAGRTICLFVPPKGF